MGWAEGQFGTKTGRSFPHNERPQQPPCLAHSDQHLLLGAEEGIFILNRNDQDATLEMVRDGGSPGGAGRACNVEWELQTSPQISAALPWPDNLGVLHQQPSHVSLRSACGLWRAGARRRGMGGCMPGKVWMSLQRH